MGNSGLEILGTGKKFSRLGFLLHFQAVTV